PTGGRPIDVIRSDRTELRDGRFDAPLAFIGIAADGADQWVEVRMRESDSTDAFAALAPRQSTHPAPKQTAAVAGMGQAYDIAFAPDTLIGNSTVLLGSINAPAGSYVAF